MNESNLFVDVERLKNILVARARHENVSKKEYIKLREKLISIPSVREKLPRFVISCLNLQEFWYFIKPKFSSYAERDHFLQEQFEPLINVFERDVDSFHSRSNDKKSFRYQFPTGLPFGQKKPNVAFRPEDGGQQIYFEDEPGVGVIRDEVYPNFTYQDLHKALSHRRISDLFQRLISLNQTEIEKIFLLSYAHSYEMISHQIPVLIPQAWIQWHSKSKQDLRSKFSSYADELYRVDFVAFWNHKRFAILIDDISHYSKRIQGIWKADENSYSKRLKEDRKLRKEGWQVFRLSNWEVRKNDLLNGVLVDLKDFIGF